MWTRFLTVILVSLLMDEAIPKGGGGDLFGGLIEGIYPWNWGRQRPPPKRPGQGFGSRGGFGGFRTGAGPGSYSSGHSFRKAFLGGALGAVGGMLAFEAGKYIILSMDTPVSYEGRDYFFDIYPRMRNETINETITHSNLMLCSVPLEELKKLSGKPVRAKRRDPWSSSTTSLLTTISTPPTTMKPDKILDSIQYRNGTRPQVIMWACIRDAELCCGTDCCPEDDGITVDDVFRWIGLIIIIVLIVCFCCGLLCYILIILFAPKALQGVQPDNPSPQVHGPDGCPQSYPPEGDTSTDKPPEGYPPEGYPPERFPPKAPSGRHEQSKSHKSDRTLEQQKGAKTSKEGLESAFKEGSKSKENEQQSKEGVPDKRSRNQKKEKKS